MIGNNFSVNPPHEGKYLVFYKSQTMNYDTKEIIDKGLYITFARWNGEKWINLYGNPFFWMEVIPPENNPSSCSFCYHCIWLSNFKFCKLLEQELNPWFRINAKLKNCPLNNVYSNAELYTLVKNNGETYIFSSEEEITIPEND